MKWFATQPSPQRSPQQVWAQRIAWGTVAWMAWCSLPEMELGVIVTCSPYIYMALVIPVLRSTRAVVVVTATSVISCLVGSYWIRLVLNAPRDAQNGVAIMILVFLQFAPCLVTTCPSLCRHLNTMVPKIFLVAVTLFVSLLSSMYLVLAALGLAD